jgi:hypothetical protein
MTLRFGVGETREAPQKRSPKTTLHERLSGFVFYVRLGLQFLFQKGLVGYERDFSCRALDVSVATRKRICRRANSNVNVDCRPGQVGWKRTLDFARRQTDRSRTRFASHGDQRSRRRGKIDSVDGNFRASLEQTATGKDSLDLHYRRSRLDRFEKVARVHVESSIHQDAIGCLSNVEPVVSLQLDFAIQTGMNAGSTLVQDDPPQTVFEFTHDNVSPQLPTEMIRLELDDPVRARIQFHDGLRVTGTVPNAFSRGSFRALVVGMAVPVPFLNEIELVLGSLIRYLISGITSGGNVAKTATTTITTAAAR